MTKYCNTGTANFKSGKNISGKLKFENRRDADVIVLIVKNMWLNKLKHTEIFYILWDHSFSMYTIFFLKNYYFLPPDNHTCVEVTRGEKFGVSENFAYALNELSFLTLIEFKPNRHLPAQS